MVGEFKDILNRYWGYTGLRGVQQQVIESILAGRDTLALMPTGAGKSLTYQLPTMMCEGLCIVVTPLIALMKDQVDGLRRRGISAVAIHSGQSMGAIEIALDNCTYGDVKFLYIAPERLAGELFRMQLARMRVSLVAVDEAHCISQWGYDFRPSYLQIADIRQIHPSVPIVALTATATEAVASDIMERLGFGSDGKIIRSDFSRPNISFSVRHTDDKREQLTRILSNVEGSAIVYVRSRERAEKVAGELAEEGFIADFYHAGVPYSERVERQNSWFSGTTRVIVATTAFGMGIDKADVRTVVHYEPPASLEEYYQEAGRAGRDGRRSYAVLMVGSDDVGRLTRRLDHEFPPLGEVTRIYDCLCNALQVGYGEGKFYAAAFNPHEFCRRNHLYIPTLMGALSILQQNGYLTFDQISESPARLMFCVSRDDLYSLRINRADLDDILRAILRLYTGVFSDFRPIDTTEIASLTGYSEERVRELLKTLWQLHVIRYIPRAREPLLTLLENRPQEPPYISPSTLASRRKSALKRVEAMVDYLTQTGECRAMLLQRYFGQADAAPCGVCDVCLARRRGEYNEQLRERVVKVMQAEAMDIKALAAHFREPVEMVIRAVEKLLSDGTVATGADGRLHLQ